MKRLLFLLLFPLFTIANPYHNMIMESSEKDRIKFFNKYIKDRDTQCDVQRTYYQGKIKNEEEYFWNVKCKKGEDLAFYIDVNGTMRMMPCNVMKLLTDIDCFRELN